MDEEDPIRLKRGADAPPDLVRALDALRRGTDETARLERVSAKLGPLLDAPPPSVPAETSGASAASYKLTMLKLILGGLVLLAPVLWMMRNDGAAKPNDDQPANDAAAVANGPDPAPAQSVAPPAPKAAPAPRADVSAQPREQSSGEGARDRVRGRAQRGEARRVRGQGEGTPATAAFDPSESAAEGARAPASEQGPSTAAAEPSSPSPAPTPSRTHAEAAKVDATTPPAPSEAQLLFAARKAMPDDPTLALRLLTEHQQRYPEGVFVPEREVLAIEALRGLGRTAEATARLRRFKARYPNSFHLQRLEQ